MTNKEALDSLKFEVYEEGHCSYIEQELDLAIQALEKQVPQEITILELPYRGKTRNRYKCPNCDNIFRSYFWFCPWCGQAVTWKSVK